MKLSDIMPADGSHEPGTPKSRYLAAGAKFLRQFQKACSDAGKPLLQTTIRKNPAGPGIAGEVTLCASLGRKNLYVMIGQNFHGPGPQVMYRVGVRNFATDGVNRFSQRLTLTPSDLVGDVFGE